MKPNRPYNCAKCKGRTLDCGKSFCPILARSTSMFKVKDKIQNSMKQGEFFGSAPAPFVGRFGYPYVNVGILSPPEHLDNAWLLDAPNYWADNDYKIPQIVDCRSQLINSRFKQQINTFDSRFLELTQDVTLSKKPVDVEIKLKKDPYIQMTANPDVLPMGPTANLTKVDLADNPRIPRKIDKITNDTDLLAADGLNYLFHRGFDENYLSEILSVGTLGKKHNRKLVPTRWSITATDDTLCKSMLEKIRTYDNRTDYSAHFGGYLGNYYLILFFPDIWSYELFETYAGKSAWNPDGEIQTMTDFESYRGRTAYAENTVGGYYAARLAAAEKLFHMKRQGSVLCLRFITGEYAVPLGVWVVREAARKALKTKPIFFSSKELMLNYARLKIRKRFNLNLDLLLQKSRLLKEQKQQSKLSQFV
ncbi:hypothetical protein GF371_02835 [Candidatus Woesearchaeota archaeon]|nr:hypothetical protein [Candidatus Woesearchaeota archaeon]